MTQQFDKLHVIAQAYGFERDASHFPAPERVVNGPAEHQLLDFLLCGEAYDAWRIWKEKGPFTLDFDAIDSEACEMSDLIDDALSQGVVVADIFPVSRRDHATRNMCLAIMSAAGLLGKSQKFTKLLGYMPVKTNGDVDSPVRAWSFEDLPHLKDDQLERPELLQAVSAQSALDTVGVLDEILCWVSPEMLEKHPGQLLPFALEQYAYLTERGEDAEVFLRHGPPEKCSVSDLRNVLVERYGAVAGEGGDLDLRHASDFVMTDFECIFTVVGREPRIEDAALVEAYGSQLFKHGLGSAPDRVLCAAPRRFLEQFSRGPSEQAKLDELHLELKKAYFDQVRIKIKPDLVSAWGLDPTPGRVSRKVNALTYIWSLARNRERFENVKHLLPPSVLKKTIGDPHFTRTAIMLYQLNFMRELQCPTSGWEVILKDDQLQELLVAGCRLDQGTQLKLDLQNLDFSDYFLEKTKVYESAIRISTLPVTVDQIEIKEDMAIDLEILAKHKLWSHSSFSAQHGGYVRWRGLEHFAKLASTDEAWKGLMEVYSFNGLRSVHHMIPRHLRVQQAGRTLNL
ncbi:hypothetical protein ACYPKM_01285 [Pseudomonas aeruginosa]